MDALICGATGWVAATLTACCFASTRMLRLRALALSANLAFITYGSMAGLAPVLVLHLFLAPLNAWHLLLQWRAARADAVALQRAATEQPSSTARTDRAGYRQRARRRPLRPKAIGPGARLAVSTAPVGRQRVLLREAPDAPRSLCDRCSATLR